MTTIIFNQSLSTLQNGQYIEYAGNQPCTLDDATAAEFIADGVATAYTPSGGGGTWGSITGTLSSQTDLNTALAGKVATSTTVAGHALSGNVTVSKSDVGLGSVANSLQLVAANNLSDVANAGTSRTNLGLGTASTHATTDYVASGTNIVNTLGGITGDITLGTNLSLSGSTLNASGGGGGGEPAGSPNEIQFNYGGSFGGSPDMTYDPSTGSTSKAIQLGQAAAPTMPGELALGYSWDGSSSQNSGYSFIYLDNTIGITGGHDVYIGGNNSLPMPQPIQIPANWTYAMEFDVLTVYPDGTTNRFIFGGTAQNTGASCSAVGNWWYKQESSGTGVVDGQYIPGHNSFILGGFPPFLPKEDTGRNLVIAIFDMGGTISIQIGGAEGGGGELPSGAKIFGVCKALKIYQVTAGSNS